MTGGGVGPRPDHELVDERLGDAASYGDLESGEEYAVRAHCVGHPLAAGGGCGWSGTAMRKSNVMPSCPKCGGWAEPDQAQGGLRVVS